MPELIHIADKGIVKRLEHETVRIENLETQEMKLNPSDICLNLRMTIQGWYHRHGLEASASRSHWDKLKELFGRDPLYYPIYEHMNALWAFRWDGHPVLFYKDSRGVSLQVLDNFPPEEIFPLYRELIKVLEAGPLVLEEKV